MTFTGGEPTLQFEELKTALILLKKAGISAAIESNATHPRLAELFPLLDALILDFKHWDDGAHFAATGQHNRAVKENLCAAFSLHPNLLVRTVLIKGFNDTQNDAEAFAAFYRKNGGERAKFEFLPLSRVRKGKVEKMRARIRRDRRVRVRTDRADLRRNLSAKSFERRKDVKE